MAEYTLYGDALSGNCYKVALMLTLTGCDWRVTFEDYMSGVTRTDDYRATLNEQGEMPVLDHNGKRLSQSGVILTYLSTRTGKFGGKSEDERLEILRWILFDNHKFTSYFATLRFLFGIQKTGETPVVEFLRGRALTAWGIADKHLANSPFIVGDAPTIADFSMAGYVFYPEETGIDRAKFPHLNAWTERLKALPGWKHPYDLLPAKAG
ncbi:MAG TPA: glutathione S-transferase family protein [Magnetospirillaceae bacterium]